MTTTSKYGLSDKLSTFDLIRDLDKEKINFQKCGLIFGDKMIGHLRK